MDLKPGPSKRSSGVKISSAHSKKRKKSEGSDSLDFSECSSEEAVYSQCGVEEESSGEDSDGSIFDTRINRKLLENRQKTLNKVSQLASPNLHDDDLPELPDSFLNLSATPTVSLLRSDAPTPDLICEDDHLAPTTPVPPAAPPLPSIEDAANTSSTSTQPHYDYGGSYEQEVTSGWSTNGVMKDFEFTKMQELLIPAPSDPFETFKLLMSDNMLDLVVRETNLNAERLFRQPGVTEQSRITNWKELTRMELLTFLGLLLHTGTNRLNRLSDYWKTHYLFNSPCFSQFMSRNRFMLILRCLHFSSEASDEDRLAKIRPIVDHFNQTMKNIYCPGKQLSLDESMVLWRGRLVFRQYIKNKRHKFGIKLYVLAEPEGIVHKFHIYSGAGDETSGVGHTQKIVLKLMEERLDSGHSLYMDNYYNSFELATKLLERKTYCTGTLSKNRRGNPEELNAVNLRQGENKSLFLNGVHIGKWKDKRTVLYISTEHDSEMLEVTNKRDQVIVKPSAIVHYNNFMSGVDLQDQMLAYYPCERKTIRWYKKMFIHILQMSLSNSFYLYNKFYAHDKINLYDFRICVLEQLLPNPSQAIQKRILVIPHKLTKIENMKMRVKKEGNNTRTVREVVRKECRGCRRLKKRTATLYECKGCHGAPGYCTECFSEAHS